MGTPTGYALLKSPSWSLSSSFLIGAAVVAVAVVVEPVGIVIAVVAVVAVVGVSRNGIDGTTAQTKASSRLCPQL